MNGKLFKGYVLVVISGLLLLAAAVLVVLQWGNVADFTAYGPHVSVNTALLMLLSAAGGIVAVFLLKALFRGIKDLRQGHRDADVKRAVQQSKAQDKTQAQ